MIQGIDIFAPRDNGLPDFSKVTPAQIFNGSLAASLNSQNDPLGLRDTTPGYGGVAESPWRNTTIDARTGKRVEVRKATVVDEMLNGGSAERRGFKKIGRTGGGGGGYTSPGGVEEPPLPQAPETPADGSLLNVPAPNWHPPMAPDYNPPPPAGIEPAEDGNILLPHVDMSPEERRTSALRRLPTMLLEELKNLRMIT